MLEMVEVPLTHVLPSLAQEIILPLLMAFAATAANATITDHDNNLLLRMTVTSVTVDLLF